MRNWHLALISSIGLAFGCVSLRAQTPDPLVLVRDGQPQSTIVLAAEPRASAQLAAFELQHYLQKMSGATIPIAREPGEVTGARILVGASAATLALGHAVDDLGEQEYVIKTLPETLLLVGHDGPSVADVQYEDYRSLYDAASGPIGTCYAVHAFLENTLGVRWYYPNEEMGEVVPSSATIAVGELDVRRRPDAPIRQIYPLFSNTEQLYYTDWDQPTKFQSSWVNARTSLLYWIRNRLWGAMRYGANHSFHGYDVAFGESHPEWFSTKSYERMKQLRYQGGVQPCLTAPGFFEQVAQIARDYFDGKEATYPDTYRACVGDFFPVVPNDNTNMCGCPDCRAQYGSDLGPAGNASHYVWGFVNRIAREVRETHPDAMVSGLAYFNYTTPPTDMVFEPNVAVTFCKFYTGYWDKNYQERDYQRIAHYINDNKAKFFTTYEYPCHPFMSRMPFPCIVPHVQADDVRRLSKMDGFMGGTQDRTYLQSYTGERAAGVAWASPVLDFMNVYWRMKLYDDFSFDFEGRLEEYYQQFYGPGSPGIKKFYTAMEDRWMELGGGRDARTWWGKLGTPAFLEEAEGYIQQATQATEEGTIYRKRVELVDAGIMQHLLKARAIYEGSAMAEFAPVATAAVARTGVPATPDGWADDATWASSLPNEINRTHFNDPAPEKTVFKLAHDDDYLYIKATCQESRIPQMKATTHDDDVGGFSDDSIELFVDPGGKGHTYHQFCINSLGAVYDALEDPAAIGATATITWDSGIKTKTAVGDDYWELRAALPFASLVAETPQPGSTWRFNLCRNRFAEEDGPPFSAWSPTLGSFLNPERFGVITFNRPEDEGRTLWACDFESDAFSSPTGESPLIGLDGWYEAINYANRGWDASWRVTEADGNRFAVCDVNSTNTSDMVPVHCVGAFPGTVSVEAMFRRHSLEGNSPSIYVRDLQGHVMASIYAWQGRGDLVAVEKQPVRMNFGDDAHGLGDVAGAAKWFGLKAVIDTTRREVTGYVKSGNGEWVRLNDEPVPYLDAEATGTQLAIAFGSRKHGPADDNVVDMDDIRVMQLSGPE
ncbi:MAG TPA: DUF4838 domain-containing protein [Armatimonadota bacterium]|nr:DUF4838 domain-containing protein [Armatimonadota bacterium]